MDYQLLWNELTTDPAGVGYVAPTDPANDGTNVGLINDETQAAPRDSISGAELWEATDLSEYQALGVAARQAFDVLVNLGTIDVREGTNSRTALAALFPAGSTTRANLIALAEDTYTTSRAALLGLGRVYTDDIGTARARYGG